VDEREGQEDGERVGRARATHLLVELLRQDVDAEGVLRIVGPESHLSKHLLAQQRVSVRAREARGEGRARRRKPGRAGGQSADAMLPSRLARSYEWRGLIWLVNEHDMTHDGWPVAQLRAGRGESARVGDDDERWRRRRTRG